MNKYINIKDNQWMFVSLIDNIGGSNIGTVYSSLGV